MNDIQKPKVYREVIDGLVHVCRKGQGQVSAERVRTGIWNGNASIDFIPEQHEINLLLGRLNETDRDILARMLANKIEVGVFETLKVLEQLEVVPFENGYEGSPSNDFIDRMDKWEWPKA